MAARWIKTLGAFCILAVAGCSTLSRNASAPIAAQKGGYATGAGASVVQPVNSAAASTQTAKRDIYYAPAYRYQPDPEHPMVSGDVIEPPVIPVVPVYSHEESSTSLGEHQDAAGILKAAKQLPLIIWAGLAGIIFGIGGYLHSHENEKSGYPFVWIMTGGIGLFLVLLAASGDLSSGWIACYLAPAAFYAVQKFGLLNIPRIP